MYIAKPTEKQLEWQDLEVGVLIHYLMESYEPYFNIDSENMEERVPAAELNPPKLDPEQWVRSAWEMGAKYAVLVAKHGSGFALWNTKENNYGCGQMAWKDGKGDVFREFLDACKKYGLKPGVYYHPTCNKYYKINNMIRYDYKGEMYQEYVRHVVGQLTELWTQYGEIFEIWFDGGCLPVEDGGPDLGALLRKYQPDAIAFQGPKDHPHNLRWVGNEDGLAPENCWATTNAGEARYDGTVPNEQAGVGDPDGKYYWPAETDMPNRAPAPGGRGGWGWWEGEEHLAFAPEYLLDCYVRSVGRNSNLLIGMAIGVTGISRMKNSSGLSEN
ncbi:MAG: alpha-L-fucosidase [Clostridia bacterium]|nr:alpha-L-fucosidase [Clostridia bacterium]